VTPYQMLLYLVVRTNRPNEHQILIILKKIQDLFVYYIIYNIYYPVCGKNILTN
jgi:hypothetical protein